ncbi:MAG: xanthine dehydrogenase family protein molybdopterin-binding subunit [Treponema sp.]|nr:xanthine dehydrogenase family protein molybdopterin-binding subunit [Treponema sp.]
MKNSDFLEDIYPQHLLYAVTIRSPIAKGYLKLIRYPELPINYYMITAENIPGENRLEDTTMPILADSNLSYIGEPVAILIGPDKAKLEELADECVVITDEEKAIFTCEEAAENRESEDMLDKNDTIDKNEIIDTNDKIKTITREVQIGNTEEAFVKSGKIVTGSYITGIQDHWYAEPAGAITWYYSEHENKKNKAESGKLKEVKKTLVVRTATQWSHHVKRCVSLVLGIDPSTISVEHTSLSMHMDGKLWFPSLIACHSAIGTYITKKPVRLILSRKEDFLFSPKRCNSSIDIASIIDENGNINAALVDISVNIGAYGVNSEEILDQVCLGSIGYYNIDNLKITARAERTNIPPQGPFSGFGLSQGFFAIERHVSQIADMVKQDPAQWRKNHINPNSILPSNSSKNDICGGDLIDTAVKVGDYYRKWASYELLRQSHKGKAQENGENPRGIGIAVGFQGNGLLYHNKDSGYNVEVTLTKEGILEIKTSISSSEDYSKIWEKVVMEIMSIEPNMLRIVTTSSPDCGPSCASRNITAVTKVVEKCCHAIRKQRFHNPLPITVRRSIKPQYGSLLNGCFTAPAGKQLDISGFVKSGMACAVVEVSIDIVECIPKIRGVWLSVAGGKIISPNRARRSLMRSAVQALGWAFTEDIEYINGTLTKDMYDNFAIPSPADIPPIHIEFIADNGKEPRGIGELPFSCIPAAFIQAVSQAMDYSFKSIPLKRKEVWEMVRLRNIESPTQGSK